MAKRATTIRTNQIADAAITEVELATSVAGAGLGGGAGTALSVNVDDSSIEISTDTLQIKASGVTDAMLANDYIQTSEVDGTTIEFSGGNLNVVANGIGAAELDETDTYDFSSGSVTVATPTADGEAANKGYVDGLVNGLDWKGSARLATDANSNWTSSATITFSDPTLTISGLTAGTSRGLIDGVEPVDGDRILIKDAAAASGGAAADDQYNGLWEVTGGTTTTLTLTRTTDADTDAEVTSGLAAFIEEGTNNADNGYVLTTNDPITVNTTDLTFTQFTGAGQITAGVGLTKTGNTIDLDLDTLTSAVVDVSADEIAIVDATDGSTKKEAIADVVTAIAGDGLSATSGVLALDINELTAVAVDVSADLVAIEDATDSSTKKESIADIMTAVAGDGLSATSGVLAVNVDDSTIEISTDTLQVKDLGITNGKIANDTIQEAKLNATNAPSDGQLLSYNSAGTNFTWVDPAGAAGAVEEADIQVEEFAGDDSTTAFVLSNTPLTNSMVVFINSAYGRRGAGKDYTLSGSTVTVLGDVLATGETLTVHYIIDN